MEQAAFLAKVGWDNAVRADFGGDFSSRHYARLTLRGHAPETAILMMAPPDQKTDIFVFVAELLRQLGLAAPKIYGAEVGCGLALLEDFGDKNCGALLDNGAVRKVFDQGVARVLAHLHERFNADAVSFQMQALAMPHFNSDLFAEQAGLFLDYYYPFATGNAAPDDFRVAFKKAWTTVLAPIDATPRTLLLRDFMPDNVMLLPAPVEGQSFGLLDFQDAGLGPEAYDLASWCEHVRRDCNLSVLSDLVKDYVKLRPEKKGDDLEAQARLLLAQRYTRILGILVKLDKSAFRPRVEEGLKTLLGDASLKPVADLLLERLP